MRGEKEKSIEEKEVVLVAKVFAITRVWLIWFDTFLEQVNGNEKMHVDWTNRYILEQVFREEQQTQDCQFPADK